MPAELLQIISTMKKDWLIGKKRIGELLGMVDELKAKDMFELKDIYEVRERLIVCQTLIEHLRARKETRWHSFGENTDYPEESSKWLKYVNSKRKPDGETEIHFQRTGDRRKGI